MWKYPRILKHMKTDEVAIPPGLVNKTYLPGCLSEPLMAKKSPFLFSDLSALTAKSENKKAF